MGDDNSHYAVYTSNLGNLYVERGRYREALPLLLKASAIFEKANKLSSEYATSLNNLAVLYNDMGQPEKAQELFQQSLEVDHQIFGDGDPKLIQDWMNLSTTLMQDQQYIEAAKFLKKAYDVAVKTLPPKHPTFARILQRFGDIYLDSGQFKEAETYAVMAEDIWWTTVGENNPDHADALIRMAWVARALGRYQDAENVTRRALNVYQQTAPEAHARLAEAHRILTGICAATDRAQEALAHMQELALAGDRQIGQVLSIGTENQRLSAASSVLSDLYLFISLALSDQNAVPKAFDLVLRRKAIDAEALAAQRDSILAGRNSSLEPQFRELGALRMQIARKTLAGPGPEGPDTHQKLLKEWKARQESLESELAQKVPEMDLEQKLHKADHQAVAEALPDGSALIEFVRFGKFDFKAIPAKGDSYWKPARYLAFILLARQPDKVEMIDLGEADSIDRQIALFRQSITGNKELIEQKAVSPAPKENTNVSVRSDRPSLCTALAETTRSLRPVVTTTEQLDRISIGTELRRILFDRLLPTLEGRTRLFLATDSNLTRLPFEVLPMDEKSCIIDSYQVSYLSTGRDILRFGASINRHPAEPIVAADPNFDLGGTKMKHFNEGFPFQRLEGTRQEGEKIASLLKVTPLFQDTVLEKTLKAHKSPRIMHISTHGFFMPNSERAPNKAKQTLAPIQIGNGDRLSLLSVLQNPLLQSGLALAGANTWLQEQEQVLPEDAEDGILSAEDVSGLDLLDTELVVLSACETGLGSIQAGEGVFGFQRAFTIAGAKTLVMSLWKVPDNATKILMEKFYQFVLDGMPRFEALCKAKMAVKQQLIDEGQENNPFLWGAFICQGDPGPLGKWQDSVSTAGETR
jgi:CHAT domain-containing protein/tetratricopeptide (TPR) repeat protein